MATARRPTIGKFADAIAKADPGIEVPGAMWLAVLRMFYGERLSASDVDLIAVATHRSPAAIRRVARGGKGFRELWARVGRRGRKSSTAALVVVYELLFGGHEKRLMSGERGLAAVIAIDIASATTVARFATTYLDALGIGWKWSSIGAIKTISLTDHPFEIAVLACDENAPRSFPICCLVLDEAAHISDSKDQPTDADGKLVTRASEILGNAGPAMAQFPGAKVIGISSPSGKDGLHFERVERGLGADEERTVLAIEGATWIFNETITEAVTHELEPDPKRHAREYGAVPGEGVSQALDPDDIDQVFRAFEPVKRFPPIVACDPSSGRRDSFGIVVAGWSIDAQQRFALELRHIEALDPLEVRTRGLDGVATRVADVGRRWGANMCASDQREALGLGSLLKRTGLGFYECVWGEKNRNDAVVALRRMLAEGKLVATAPPGDLRRGLVSLKEYVSGGTVRYSHPADLVACVLTTLMYIGQFPLAGTPSFGVRELPDVPRVSDPNSMLNQVRGLHGRGLDKLEFSPSGNLVIGSGLRRQSYTFNGRGSGGF